MFGWSMKKPSIPASRNTRTSASERTNSCGFSEPIFTPATEAETGHDLNISFDRTVEMVGGANAEQLRDLTLKIYGRACSAQVVQEKRP
ncbi:MAG: hypothetical protein HXY20_12690 [Acidobacteria bacterium]|nr:hypothetical protein [Acidobacteriota bacterium]